jgi:hypothetical protein
MKVHRELSLAIVVLTMLAAGCNRSGEATSPLSPSSLPSPSPGSASATGATVSGIVESGGTAPLAGMSVSVAGTDISAAVDVSGRFTLAGVPPGDVHLRISGGSVDAAIDLPAVAEQEQIEIAVAVISGTATVTAQQRTDSSHRTELRGAVSGLGGACPDLTFTVKGNAVVTSSATIVEDGPCSAIQNGTKVEIKGTRQANGSVLATKVDIDTPPSSPPPPYVEVKGTVSALAGSCPNATFTVNGTSVATNAATIFEDGPCSAVQNGTRVEVKGTRQTDGSVLATKVDIDTPPSSPPPPRVEVKGAVSALAGGCPNATFTVNGTSVATNASTIFEDGPCSAVQNGTRVEVKGTRQADGGVLAAKVDIDEPDLEVEVKGTVSALGGACPGISFSVNGTAVAATSVTRFEDGLCSTIANGTRVEVKGIRQSNGTVQAAEIDIDEPDLDVEVKGALSGLSGTCPALAFTVRGTSVVTNGSTRFSDGPCSAVQNGRRVEVDGIRQSNGTVLAHKVELD